MATLARYEAAVRDNAVTICSYTGYARRDCSETNDLVRIHILDGC